MAGDNDRNAAIGGFHVLGRFFHESAHGFGIVGVHFFDEIDAATFDHPFQGDGVPFTAVGPDADAGSGLHAGHGGDEIIQDHQDKPGVIVDGV